MHFNYDVFISYSHKDSAWVHSELLKRVENHGFSVAIDFRDFKGGAFSVDEMERCVQESRHVVPVFTPDYFNSEWSKLENIMTQTLDPGAVQRKLIPILRIDCTIPLRLRIINYIDLRMNDRQKWDMLFQSLI